MARPYSPPARPTEGQRWKSGGSIYRWQAGHGWVAEADYREPLLGRRAQEAIEIGLVAPPADRRARLLDGLKAQLRASNAFLLTLPDDSPRWRWDALIAALHIFATPLQLAAKGPRCESCGGPRSEASGGLCRKCYVAHRWPDGRRESPQPTCSDCGGPRSRFAAGTRCRTCWRAHFEAERARRAGFSAEWHDVLALIAHLAREAQRPPTAPEPEPIVPAMVERERQISEMMEADAPAPQPAARPVPAPPPAPSPSPPRALPAAQPTDDRVEVSAPGFKPPADPFAKRDRQRGPAVPDFPPEFLEKLRRVGAGEVGIVEVAPIPRRGVAESGGGSSLGFDA